MTKSVASTAPALRQPPTSGTWFKIPSRPGMVHISNTTLSTWLSPACYVGEVTAQNADLVVAAPRMCAALRDMVTADNYGYGLDTMHALGYFAAARAVLLQAVGEDYTPPYPRPSDTVLALLRACDAVFAALGELDERNLPGLIEPIKALQDAVRNARAGIPPLPSVDPPAPEASSAADPDQRDAT
jgi:hypothetical protein